MKKIVVVDIDGTIAEIGRRAQIIIKDFSDWDNFYLDDFDDEPILPIIDLVYALYLQNYRIVFCTSRRVACRDKTIKWINKHFEPEVLKYGVLCMRKDGDERHDTVVKVELLKDAGINFKDIAFVLEDRACMVARWRELGFICLQVAENNN